MAEMRQWVALRQPREMGFIPMNENVGWDRNNEAQAAIGTNMNVNSRTKLSRNGFARVASFHRIALTLILLGLPGLLPAQTLEHRYSFVSDASDSVGGSAWNGTIVAPGNAGGSPATIANGLSLPGGGGGDFSGYVALPSGILVGDTSLSVECWVTQNSPNGWGTVWDFANDGNHNFEMCPYPENNDNNLMSAFTPHQNEEDVQTTNSFPSGIEQYVVVTYDNANLTGILYLDGAQVGTRVMPDATYAPAGIGGATGTAQNWLGNDTYGDTQFQGTIYELRIWNGAISQRQIAASALLGPGVFVTNLTPSSASVTAGPGVYVTGTEQATINVTLEQTGTTNLIATVDATNWTSSDTNVLSVNSAGLITGVGVGTATVSATIAGVHTGNSGPITVTPETLAHRYSFATDASDSVGGSNWDGTLEAPLTGNAASISNGLILPGNTSGGFGYSGYVSFPSGILTNTTSLTVECWVTQNQGNGWAEIWDFGNNDNQNFALIPDPGDNNEKAEVAFNPDADNTELDSATAFPNNSEQYVCLTYNNSTLTGALYTNGVLDASQMYPDAVFAPGDTIYAPGNIGGANGTTENMLGNDVYGDWQFDGTIYEFRIWNGAVSPLYVAVSAAAGSSVVVTNVTPLSVDLTVATNMVGAQIQQATISASFPQATNVPVTSAAINWTSSDTSILTVSSSGLITALSGGNATISATVGSVTTTSATITVALTAPTIPQPPAAEVAVVGETATFTVGALGGDLTYQWSEGGVPIPGATNATLTLTNLTLAEAGNITVLVTNALGMTNSIVATLTVDTSLLEHRYSFVSDASDSVGGPAWNGSIVPPGNGSPATINNGLTLPGGGGGGFSGYVALPSGILVGDTSLSIECWFTQNSPNGWATVWDFANSGSENFEMCPYPENNDDNLMSAFTPHGNEEDVQTTNSFPSGVEQYVVVTYDNANLAGNIYLDGDQVGTRVMPDATYAPAGIGGEDGTFQNWLGNDTYGDTQFQGTIYELRIWNGVISQRQIAASALLGPSVMVTNLTPTSASVAAGPGVVVTGTEQATINITLDQTGSTNLIATVDATNWISSDPSVLTVNSSGLITGVGAGTATVSAMIGGVATGNSGPITVTPQTLEHRYSFATDASDSVGGTNWDGTLVAPVAGNAATIDNGLILPGNTVGGFGYSGYVSLPSGILTNTTSITVECWLTQNQGNGWAEAWDFGNNGNQNFALIPDPDDNGNRMDLAFNPDADNIELDTPTVFPNNSEQYVCLTYNNSTLTADLYTNGVLDASQVYPNAVFAPGDTVYAPGSIGGADGTTENMLGNDVYGDWQFDGTIYEFRIWNGAVSPLYVAVSAAAGPSVVVTNLTPSLVTVTAGTSLTAAQTEQATVVGKFAAGTNITVTGAATNWTSSATNVLTVSSSGLITAVGAGSATVSATVGGVNGTSTSITVASSILGIAPDGANVVLTWSGGTLLQAPTLLGPWTTNSAAVSPFTTPATNGAEFYKIEEP